MTQFPELFAALGAPFEPQEVRVRTQAGRQLSYITARTAMNRLDTVLGPENWWDEYVPGENSVICKLTIRLPDGSTLAKCDAGGYAGMADQGDDDKSGFSDAFKRAAVKFGVGRYLYRDGVPTFSDKDGEVLLSPAKVYGAGESRPGPEPPRRPRAQQQARDGQQPSAGGGNGNGQGQQGQTPRTGRAFFAWCKEKEQDYEVGLIKYMNNWARLQDYPGRMVDWDAEQVKFALKEAERKLRSLGDAPAETYEEALAN